MFFGRGISLPNIFVRKLRGMFFCGNMPRMPSDLPEIGHPQLVSEFLNGQRYLNTQQIRTLNERFHVSPAVFL
jgi:antitoxin component HigA of HigAB toxin-antitoxin module